jgi:hypothetical protein
MDRDAAQARLNRIRAFSAELEALRQAGVLSLDAAQQDAFSAYHRALIADLTARFDLDRDDTQRRMSVGMQIASVLGAIALSAAIFLFFYRIWGLLAIGVQVAALAAAPVVAVAATEFAHRHDRTRHFVFLFAVIACASIVMNVALIGDIFSMTDSPNALAIWAAFGLAIGYAYGLRLPVAVGLTLAIVFAAASMISWRGIDWKSFAERPELFLPPGSVVFAIGCVATSEAMRRFVATWRLIGLAVLLIALLALSIGGAYLSVLPWPETPVKASYQVLGFASAGGAVALGARRDWTETTNLGAGGFVVFLYTKFYQWWWDWMPAYLFFLIVGLVAVAIILLLRRLRGALTPVST